MIEFQNFVEALKKNGTFDKESQKVALIKEKNDTLAQMSDEIKNYITKNYCDLGTWIIN